MTNIVDPHRVTSLLHAAGNGDTDALHHAIALMYDVLYQIARSQLVGEQPNPMLSATVLVNEAWLRVFADSTPPQWENRGHLLGIAARAMRQVLIDQARRRKAAKRPQDENRLCLTEIAESLGDMAEPDELEAALARLAELDERQAHIVDMRFFVGLTGEQIAAATGLSTSTVQREWRMARAWLRRELGVE